MWFKNFNLFSLSGDVPYDPTALAEELSSYPFSPCSKVTPFSAGFVPPIGDEDGPLVHGADGYMLFCLKIQKKVLPTSVINEQHTEQVAALESSQGRKLYKDEKQRMKDELYYTLLSQAFVTSSRVYGYFDTKRNELVLSSTVAKDLEKLFLYFNKIFPEQAMAPHSLQSPSAVMTHWLRKQEYPNCFSLADNCVVCEGDERKGVVRFTRKDLATEALQKLLTEGSQVIQLGINWREQIQCQLRKDLTVTGVKFHDSVRDAAKDVLTETEEDRQATDFFMMAETVSRFLQDLLPEFLESSAVSRDKKQESEGVFA
jgi:recombination associated protein RdgC